MIYEISHPGFYVRNCENGCESGSVDCSARRKTYAGPSYLCNSSPNIPWINPNETDRCIEFPKLNDFKSQWVCRLISGKWTFISLLHNEQFLRSYWYKTETYTSSGWKHWKPHRYVQNLRTANKNSGGIDLQVLSIGANGHILFNETTGSFVFRPWIKTLNEQTMRKMIEEPISAFCSASILQMHLQVTVVVDKEAAFFWL